MTQKQLETLWDESYRFHIEPIDTQHHHLLELIERLNRRIERAISATDNRNRPALGADVSGGGAEPELQETLWSLIDYCYLHLDREEQMLEACNYPGLLEHLYQHMAFQQMLVEFVEQIGAATLEQYHQLGDALQRWWQHHIDEADRGYVPTLQRAEQKREQGAAQRPLSDADSQPTTQSATQSTNLEITIAAHQVARLNRTMRQHTLALLSRNIELDERVSSQQAESEMILNAMGDGLVVADRQGSMRTINAKLQQLSGKSLAELQQQPVGTLFVEEEEEEEDVSGKVQRLYQNRLQHLHDHDHDAFHRFLIEAPIPLLVVNQAEVDGVPAPIFLASQQLERLLGYRHGALQGISLCDLLPDEDRQRLQRRIAEADAQLACVKEKRCHWLHADGHPVDSSICLLQIRCGSRQHIIIQIRTDQTLSRDLLALTPFGRVFVEEEEEEEEFHVVRRLSNAAGDPVPVSVNGSLLYTPGGTVDGVVLVLHDLTERKRLEEREQYAAFQSGVAEMSANILHNVGNTIQGMDLCEAELAERLTELQQIAEVYSNLLQRLEQAEAESDPALQETALEAARETLIRAGRKLPGVLQESIIAPSEHMMKTLKTGIHHIKEVIRAQQKGVKIDTHAIKFPLPALLEDLRLLSEGALESCAIILREEIQPQMPEVRLPRNQLLQALINLVKNSVESIEARIAEKQLSSAEGEIQVIATLEQQRLRLEVRDNGNGFDPEISHELLRFGFTTKDFGSGFGLHATANFVGSIGGTIQLQSEGVGKGATVVLSLPLQEQR